MRRLFPILLFVGFVELRAQQSLPPVGLWREHLPYNSAIDLAEAEDRVYCATPYSIFSINKADHAIERLSRITGLSETGISAISYDAGNDKLVIAYNNSNIDILYRNDIMNVPDLKRYNTPGDKQIYAVYPLQKNYYLSTGLGVVVIDGDKYEVKDSWFIGNGGNPVKVNAVTSDAGFFYAATEEGLKKADKNSSNLNNYYNWQLVSGTNGLPAGSCKNIFTLATKVFAQKDDSLFVLNGNNWNFLYTDAWTIISSQASGNKILLCQQLSNGQSRLTLLNPDGSFFASFNQSSAISFPRKAILINNEPWLADQNKGLIHFAGSSYEQYQPNSPAATSSGEMTAYNNILYATAGGVDASWNGQQNKNGLFVLKEGIWTTISHNQFSQLDSLPDFITISIDPRDETIWAGSYGGGLLHGKESGQSFEIFKQGLIGPALSDPTSYRVSGLAFDQQNNIWVSNYGAAQPLLVRKADGSWKKFSIPFPLPENSLSQLLVDDNNYKWIVVAKTGSLICFDDASTIDNIGDDKWKLYSNGSGNGNIPPGEVLCLAKDKSGYIWVGTTNGIGVIQCTEDVFSGQGCDAVWPIVQQGNFAGYLFSGEEVRSIATDGADRKWVATSHGAWLISADGTKVIYNFTEENSPLLSSDVKKLAIDGKTGEVFFATAKGICSFRSTATEGGETNENVLIFPNPVPPGFTGTIAIRGLVNDAIVKITEPDGRLVFQTRALGGQAVWDGRDYKGRKIASGIYLVLVSNDDRTEKTAAKIVFISK